MKFKRTKALIILTACLFSSTATTFNANALSLSPREQKNVTSPLVKKIFIKVGDYIVGYIFGKVIDGIVVQITDTSNAPSYIPSEWYVEHMRGKAFAHSVTFQRGGYPGGGGYSTPDEEY